MSLATQQLSSLVTPPPQGDSDTSIMKIEIGPSHPAMHGIVRFTTYLDGEPVSYTHLTLPTICSV